MAIPRFTIEHISDNTRVTLINTALHCTVNNNRVREILHYYAHRHNGRNAHPCNRLSSVQNRVQGNTAGTRYGRRRHYRCAQHMWDGSMYIQVLTCFNQSDMLSYMDIKQIIPGETKGFKQGPMLW